MAKARVTTGNGGVPLLEVPRKCRYWQAQGLVTLSLIITLREVDFWKLAGGKANCVIGKPPEDPTKDDGSVTVWTKHLAGKGYLDPRAYVSGLVANAVGAPLAPVAAVKLADEGNRLLRGIRKRDDDALKGMSF